MRLSKFLILLLLVTTISLIYVQLQVEIFQQAYKGSLNESRLSDVLDDNSILMYNILALKSAQNVGETLLSGEQDLQFANKQQITEVKIPLNAASRGNVSLQRVQVEPNFFARIFALKSQAEAKQ